MIHHCYTYKWKYNNDTHTKYLKPKLFLSYWNEWNNLFIFIQNGGGDFYIGSTKSYDQKIISSTPGGTASSQVVKYKQCQVSNPQITVHSDL